MKKTAGILLAAVLMMIMAACGSNNNGNQEVDPDAAANAQEIKLVASNYQFDQTEYRVKKGETYNIVLENQEGVHGIEIKGAKVKLDNANSSHLFTADKAGEYDIICNIPCGPGHASMKAKLIVEE